MHQFRHSTLLSFFIFCVLGFASSACGGSSGGDEPFMTVISPEEGVALAPGETFVLSLAVENFALNRPTGMDPAVTGLQTGSLAVGHAMMTGTLKHEANENPADGHPMVNETDPNARQGHIHVYLDEGSAKDPHITTWTSDITVILPKDLAPGIHQLRLEFRNDSHVGLGSEYDQVFTFEALPDELVYPVM